MSEQKTQKVSEYDERKGKLDRLRELDIEPYPTKASRTHIVKDVLDNFDALEKDEMAVTVCGRLRSKRAHGNLSFADIEDESGRIQIAVSKKEVGENYKPFAKLVDASDFVQITGKVFITKAGQQTIMVSEWKLLAKALRSIPVEHFGLKDEDEKFRKRYLDILLNPDMKKTLEQKSKFWHAVRNFLQDEEFIEVETPVLETSAGGADAEPFVTHHNALNIDVYLRISMGELWQKRLMIAGLEKTFEIGRQFRNEGMDMEHLQDYTQMEFYMAYANYEDGMALTERLYKYVAQETFGTLKFKIKDFDVNLDKEWIKYDYTETIKKETGVDISIATIDEIEDKLQKLGVKYSKEGFNLGRAIDSLWKYCRNGIAGPGFLINLPVTVSPLAKRDPDNANITQRFQPIIAGSELGNGYSELNDPIDQAKRFSEQQDLRDAGDEEAQMYDKDFVEALEYGMPPTCGFGMSERVFAFLSNKTVRECQIFPLMKPKSENNDQQVEGDSAKKIGDLNINLKQANKLIDEHIIDPVTKLHSRESELIMRGLAHHFGEDEESWGIIGLLHDLDWDKTKNNPVKHSLLTADILKGVGASDFLITTIQSHNYGYEHSEELRDKKRSTKIQYALAAAETLTGLIVASALILPSKCVKDLKLKSLKKKFKNKKFAQRCNRDIILECEKIGLTLDEFLEIGLIALQKQADELGI